MGLPEPGKKKQNKNSAGFPAEFLFMTIESSRSVLSIVGLPFGAAGVHNKRTAVSLTIYARGGV